MFLNVLKFGLSEGLAKIAPFLTTLYVAKFLTPEFFGKYSLLIVLYEISFIFISFNIQATTRIDFFKESDASFNLIKKSHFLISFCAASLFSLGMLFFSDIDLDIILLLTFASFFRTWSVFILAILQCSKRVSEYIYLNLVFVICLSLLTFIFLNMGFSFYSWLYAIAIASVVQAIVSIYMMKLENLNFLLSININKPVMKSTFITGILFMPQAIGWWLKTGADRLIISKYWGDGVLGYYALAFQLTSIVLMGITVLNLVLVPEINLCLKNKNASKLKKILYLTIMFITAISILLPFAGEFVISTYYGNDYSESINYLRWLIVPLYLQAILMVLINLLYFSGFTHIVAKVIVISFSLQVLLSYSFIAPYGLFWLVQASSLANIIVLTVVIYYSYTIFKSLSDKTGIKI
jgi:O-antigen/teichoic acid export membrane protein